MRRFAVIALTAAVGCGGESPSPAPDDDPLEPLDSEEIATHTLSATAASGPLRFSRACRRDR